MMTKQRGGALRFPRSYCLRISVLGDGALCLIIGGARHVLIYRRERILLALKGIYLEIRGAGMTMQTYTSGILEIVGRVEQIRHSAKHPGEEAENL